MYTRKHKGHIPHTKVEEHTQEVARPKLRCLRHPQFRSAWDVTHAGPLCIPSLLSIMINTYQTSLAPPPVPPRLGRSHPVLIPGPLPLQGYNKSLIRCLFGIVLLHLFLSVGGFIYLYRNDKMVNNYIFELNTF